MYEGAALHEGICQDGPLFGLKLQSRADRGRKGVLLVDKQNNKCWIYEWDSETKTYSVRDEEPMDVQTVGEKNRFRAAEECNYDVVAAPWGGDS